MLIKAALAAIAAIGRQRAFVIAPDQFPAALFICDSS